MSRDSLYGRWFTFLPQVRTFLLETVYPEQAVCRACGRISRGGVLCGDCLSRLTADGMTFAWNREDLAPDLPAYFLRPHTGIARDLVIRLKHRAEACLADVLADLVMPVPDWITFPPETVVTWVPMPKRRREERCIDHGQMLAEAVAARLRLECRPLLRRIDNREKAQATLHREARMTNLTRAFIPVGKITVPVLLVDDVLTTGTTALRCADALREGGAREISVLAITRATSGKI